MISIVITVYNKEKFILETLNSAFSSLKENDEIVIVNDGSSDKSSDLINEFICNHDKNGLKINFIDRKNNKGVVFSKKEGLLNCKNDFVIFLDGDDIFNSNLFKNIDRSVLDKNNILFFGIKEFIGSINYFDYFSKYIVKKVKKEKIEKQLLSYDFQNSLCNKFYYKNYLIKCFDSVADNVDYAEDLLINIEYLKYIKYAFECNFPIIFYRKGIESITSKRCNNQFERISLNPFLFRNSYINNCGKIKFKYLPLNNFTEMTYSIIKENNLDCDYCKKIISKYNQYLKNYSFVKIFMNLNFKNKYRLIYMESRLK